MTKTYKNWQEWTQIDKFGASKYHVKFANWSRQERIGINRIKSD